MTQKIELIRFDNVAFGYDSHLFHQLDFTLHNGEFYFLTGCSGEGKTTFLRMIYGDLFPDDGEVSVFGVNLANLSPDDLMLVRRNMGIIFQGGRLFAHLTVLDNVALALQLAHQSVRQARRCALELLNWVGLKGLGHKYPDQLSCGQNQRVAIARAVITKPLLILADEPTANLDRQNALKIMQLLIEMHERGTAVICVTHQDELLTRFPFPHIALQRGALNAGKKDIYAYQ